MSIDLHSAWQAFRTEHTMVVWPLLIATLLFCSVVYNYSAESVHHRAMVVPGCKKIGLDSPRHLRDEHDVKHSGSQATDKSVQRIKALYIYPIKSCMPVEVETATVVKTGLKYDRQFSFARWVKSGPRSNDVNSVDTRGSSWKFITQREFPRMSQVKVELWVPDPTSSGYDATDDTIVNGGCIVISFPKPAKGSWWSKSTARHCFEVPFLPTQERMREKQYMTKEHMTIWLEDPQAFNVTNEIAADDLKSLRDFLGLKEELALFRVDPADYREVYRCAPSEEEVGYQPQVGFADAYPLSIMGISSVQDVASRLPEGHREGLKAIRFRSNIYMTGGKPYAEDDWKRIRIAGHDYHVTNRLTRCKMPNIDPDTAVRDNNQPYLSMKKHRCIDEGAGNYPCLGMHVVPSSDEQRIVCVGDVIEILQTGPHFYLMQ